MSETVGRHYTIDPRPEALGGGWKLRLIEDGVEVGAGVFPADDNERGRNEAHADALHEADCWLNAER